MGFFDGVRGRLHYRDRPVEEAAAGLVLLPGTGQHSGHYHEFARQLNHAGITVWTLDPAGQGLSEGDPAARPVLSELVADAAGFFALAHEQAPHLPLTLMGHSLGALTALAVLGATPPALDPAVAANPALPADLLGGLVLCGTPSRALGDRPGTAAPRLPPVLAVHGVDDRRAPIDPVRAWVRERDSVELREYADAGHDLLHERVRTRVTADIVQWTQEIVAGSVRRP
ncbi:alpha/beta hydrolase [Nocardia jinanensis]|uniref:Lysophospholipase n=1 Tax=Nocardia jinanensis TaxID=382504 RepID=A0A917VRT9_9NOCA|nr:alpha/beta fold hydrolase [Nocardia jinanensis]GGL08167.1 lysophospholipase [Nocardia jinanensis]